MSTDQKTIDWYNLRAADYAKHVRTPDESIYHSLYEKPAMYALLPNLEGKRVLSLGCGSGEDSSYLASKGVAHSLGIDISTELIAIAKDSHPECEFRVMDMERLDLSNESIDFVYSSLAIHYLQDWTSVAAEVFRVLKPGSSFLFSCSHPVRTAMVLTQDQETEKIRQLATINNKMTKKVTVIGDYLNRKPISDALDISSVTTWHKSMGEIADEVTRCGFLIERIVEPKPLEKMKEISQKEYEKLVKIPEFVIFKLRKTSLVESKLSRIF